MPDETAADFAARSLAESRHRERQDARAKLAGVAVIRAVVAAPDQTLAPEVVAAKRKLIELAEEMA